MSAYTLSDIRLIGPDGTTTGTTLTIEDGHIAALGGPVSRESWRCGGLLALPGIVDLHGDAFERQLMPRPGVHFDTHLALLDTDRQLISNGITTAYHGLTYSWEPGLRSNDAGRAFLTALEAMQPSLA